MAVTTEAELPASGLGSCLAVLEVGREMGRPSGCSLAVVALNLITVWLNVRFNYWNNDFYDALQQYDWPEFWRQFAIFGMLALSFIVVGVYSALSAGRYCISAGGAG